VLATVIAGDDPALAALESALAVSAEDLNEPLRSALGTFAAFCSPPSRENRRPSTARSTFFSAPGEGLETVESRAAFIA